ncbi:MAG TPA: class IV adenylate cyclase [Candidatus Methylomirabilis sp.]|nr:class IV adenylate cyclase [Candidatus Methylomirabilis sp.]
MAQETEIKLQIRDEQALRSALKRLGAQSVAASPGRVYEQNVIFDTPQGGLAKNGQLLRIRTETPHHPSSKRGSGASSRTVLTFKQPPVAASSFEQADALRRHKIREEFELEVSDPAILTRIFEGLGMKGWFRYEKYRTTYRLTHRAHWARGLLLELDETPIGTFLELEGPPEAIDRAAQELGFSKHDYILKNYLALYFEECRRKGREPRNMLFEPPPLVEAQRKKSK